MPRFIKRLFPHRIWAFSDETHSIFLTFDDGPIPHVTPWVLAELKKHNAKATFFCIGENIQKHPEIFKRIIHEGHCVGNHTFNHLKGSKTETSKYVENVLKCEEIIQKEMGSNTTPPLFRPPYGKITSMQARILKKKGFKIVMWDIISYDFDATISAEKCLQNVLVNIRPGSIIVFHDSLKAEKNLRYVLPKVLGFIDSRGWSCEAIKIKN